MRVPKRLTKRLTQTILPAFMLAVTPTLAMAESVINVTLIDRMGAPDPSKPLHLGMGLKADMQQAAMGINTNPSAVPRGEVRFNVTNLASELVHEVIIARINDDKQVLPYDETRHKVDEESLLTLGSVKEIEPSKHAALMLNLQPGKYLLYCNISGHYMSGMWTVVDVQ